MLAARPAGQAARAPRRLPAVTLTVIPPAARPRHAQAARAPSPPALAPRLRHHGHEPEREAPVPIDDRVQQLITGRQRPTPGRWPPEASLLATARHPVLRARTPAVLHGPVAGAAATALTASSRGAAAREPRPYSAGPPIIAAGIPAVAGVPALAKTFLPGRIRQGPSMYEMEGPCAASPRPAGQLAWSSPRATRRPPGPGTRARGRSPGSSRVPGVAPGWCPFPAVKALLLPPQAPRKALRPAISCFSAIHEGIHRKQAVIRISQRLSTGLLTACPQATGSLASPGVIGAGQRGRGRAAGEGSRMVPRCRVRRFGGRFRDREAEMTLHPQQAGYGGPRWRFLFR